MFSAAATVAALLLAGSPLRSLEPDGAQPAAANGPKQGQPRAVKRILVRKGAPVTIDGQDYRSLDEYLAKLERDGWVGKPWYKEIEPGLYELVTTVRPAPPKRRFTRAELERELGFRR